MSEPKHDATPNDGTVELTETQLSDVEGGLLPAVQKIREAAARSSRGGVRVAAGDVNGDSLSD
jgi:hypothetical protein